MIVLSKSTKYQNAEKVIFEQANIIFYYWIVIKGALCSFVEAIQTQNFFYLQW